MTPQDIARMMKVAKVPRSRTVMVMYPNPRIDIHVPAAYHLLIVAVVARLAMPSDNATVHILPADSERREHVLFKVKGDNRCNYQGVSIDLHPVEQRRLRRQIQLRANHNVVIDYASVAL